MENPNKSLNSFYNYPCQNLADSCCMSNKKKEKWKIQSQLQNPFSLYTHIFLLLQLLLISAFQPVSSQGWDGVIVTQADFQALQAFKHELVDPKGILRSWNDSGYGACSGGWIGIKCAQGQVIVIQLPWKGLGGRITEKIGQLQELRKLSLHDNVIGGSIPHELGFLPNLRGVQLFNNRLSGSIPPSLGSCPLLQTLDLSNNLLTGSIPSSLANSTKLFRLNLSHNSLSGLIPVSLTSSSSLIFLDLQYNNLSGAIPNSWGATQKKNNFLPLQHLSLNNNFFSGSIPSSLGKLRELQDISVSHNQINGAIPVEIGGLSRLRTLDLSYNAINGSLSDSLSNISSLVLLNLQNNYLDNQIPEAIGKLHNLSVLNLKRNQFSGHIPATIGNISTLTQLDVSDNKLSGEIPDSLADLNNLTSFNVSYNNLSGPVPIPLSQKFNSSSFVGNIQLCGYSGTAPCPSQAPAPSVPVPPPEKPKKHHRKLSTKDMILIAAGALLIVLLIICCILLCCLIRKRAASKATNGQATTRAAAARGEKGVPPAAGEVESGGEAGGKLVHFDGPMVFTADDLLCATAEIMGKSTYGTVYKATLEDGSQVAVKRLREKITKGQREFESEVNVLGKIRHPNLLALRAYYLGPKGEKLLVFDYIPKGSLATFLHARGPDTLIDWPTRMKIAQGMTRGLFYLHNNENIIHGNLTSSNVLLDERTNARIADYGLSRLMTAAASTNVIATASVLGYRAPELSKLKKANTKTDVYSLGVIILELLTGKSPGEAMNGVDLPQWVASIVKEEWTNEVFDVELMKDASIIGDELLNTLKLALHCVDPSPSARPEVQLVLQQLEEIRPETAASPGPSGDDGAGVPSTSD
ncbi:PREDICTED: probably inactive leucine-rich repeat receptor-like protein kinase IMK2 [Populus euphratica]|uniref:Probably inactive leucine-rich repeat receptor-like protein kinase IMK2 n=1 Tax=Populus euphratica TaxID=75702 RepID=A0AAJ6TQ89_POPEU|nr:PREDICTED: probably inactive leucine-rich repeat receptor-like protein kinase IMK2 [Populus euphratica]XP_011035864.1 PREDICTED: probably inactive leucine-rich repeat receptor-like protein kinase IMK2 [Populus euphratica]